MSSNGKIEASNFRKLVVMVVAHKLMKAVTVDKEPEHSFKRANLVWTYLCEFRTAENSELSYLEKAFLSVRAE